MKKSVLVLALVDYHIGGLKVFDKGGIYVFSDEKNAERLEKEGIVKIQ